MTKKIYTGVGSRKTPYNIKKIMTQVAYILEQQNWILRSGGAKGADTAFDQGIIDKSNCEIFLPKQNNNIPHGIYKHPLLEEAQKIILDNNIHPYFNNMSHINKLLHTRNVFQVLGHDLKTKSKMVVCWTSDAAKTFDECSIEKTGGTGTAIKLADLFNVPVKNLSFQKDLDSILEFIEKNKHLLPKNNVKQSKLFRKTPI